MGERKDEQREQTRAAVEAMNADIDRYCPRDAVSEVIDLAYDAGQVEIAYILTTLRKATLYGQVDALFAVAMAFNHLQGDVRSINVFQSERQLKINDPAGDLAGTLLAQAQAQVVDTSKIGRG